MKSISAKKIIWLAVVLLVLATAYLLVSANIEWLNRFADYDRPAAVPSVRHKIPAAEKPPANEGAGKATGSTTWANFTSTMC